MRTLLGIIAPIVLVHFISRVSRNARDEYWIRKHNSSEKHKKNPLSGAFCLVYDLLFFDYTIECCIEYSGRNTGVIFLYDFFCFGQL